MKIIHSFSHECLLTHKGLTCIEHTRTLSNVNLIAGYLLFKCAEIVAFDIIANFRLTHLDLENIEG